MNESTGSTDFSRLTPHVVVSHGTDDVMLPTESSISLRQNPLNAQLKLNPDLHGGSHYPYHELVAEHIRTLLDRPSKDRNVADCSEANGNDSWGTRLPAHALIAELLFYPIASTVAKGDSPYATPL